MSLLDFSGQNLQGRSFKGQDLAGANFANANISGANFSRANLTGANFTGASSGLNLSAKITFTITCLLLSAVSGVLYAVVAYFILKYQTEAFSVIKINNFGANILWLLGLVVLCVASVRFKTVSVSSTIFAVSIVNLIIACFVRLHGFSFDVQLLMNGSLLLLTLALANFLVFICANFGAFCGVLGYVVDGMNVLIASSLVGLLVAVGYTLFELSSPKLAFTLLTILVATLLSVYQAWSAINFQPKQEVILKIANDLTSDWGTRFYNADLTNANFNNANLKNADFTKAIGVTKN